MKLDSVIDHMHLYHEPCEQAYEATKSKLEDLSCTSKIEVNGATGKLIKEKVWYCGLEVCFYPSHSFSIKGSIHKYIHNGKHNYSILSYNDAVNALKELCCLFGLQPESLKIFSFEFGLNLPILYDPSLIVEHIVQYNGRIPDIDRYRKTYKWFHYDDRVIKLYDKGLQYQLPYNLLRLEVKVKKLRYLDRLTSSALMVPIRTLEDFMASDLSMIFRHNLEDIWSTMYLDESFRITNDHLLRTKAKEMLMFAKEANYWREMKGICTKEEKMKELRGIYKKCLGVSLHDEIKDYIIKSQ